MSDVQDQVRSGDFPAQNTAVGSMLARQDEMHGLLVKLASKLDTVDVAVLGLKGQLSALADQVSRIDSRVERQERRLEAIETFPQPPIRQSPRLYGTDAESVSLPLRVRAGRAG